MMATMAEEKENEDQRYPAPPRLSPALRQIIFGLLGAIAYFVLLGVTPKPIPRSILQPNPSVEGPLFLSLLFRLEEFIRSPYVNVPVFLVFLYLAVYRRDRQNSWIFAFLTGYAVPGIVFYWILRWL
jgi:hypothetical protein